MMSCIECARLEAGLSSKAGPAPSSFCSACCYSQHFNATHRASSGSSKRWVGMGRALRAGDGLQRPLGPVLHHKLMFVLWPPLLPRSGPAAVAAAQGATQAAPPAHWGHGQLPT